MFIDLWNISFCIVRGRVWGTGVDTTDQVNLPVWPNHQNTQSGSLGCQGELVSRNWIKEPKPHLTLVLFWDFLVFLMLVS